jgi:hypothetical protein
LSDVSISVPGGGLWIDNISVTASGNSLFWDDAEPGSSTMTFWGVDLERLYYDYDHVNDGGSQWHLWDETQLYNGSANLFDVGVSTGEAVCLAFQYKADDDNTRGEDTSDGLFIDDVQVTASLHEKHFVPVWEGSGTFNPMTLYCSKAQLYDIDLELYDEIAVFDGNVCVGAYVLTTPLSTSSIANIICSADDGSDNGFTEGNEILFRIWDASDSLESTPTSFSLACPTLAPIAPVPFQSLGSACVELDAPGIVPQMIALYNGWNMFSLAIEPEGSHDMLDMLSPILDTHVIKVIDEQGQTIEKIFGTWQNYIGGWLPTEGYYIKMSDNVDWEIEGSEIEAPFAIDLVSGWNMIGYICLNDEQDALNVLQSLIDNEYLIKVIDESGSTVEKIFGTWQNYIGNMKAGEGYYLKVTENCTLTETCDGDAVTAKNTTPIPVHFVKEKMSHPYKPMSLYLADVSIQGEPLQPGDEVAVFKNDQFVGSMVWQSTSRPQLLSVSAADGNIPGFSKGTYMSFKIWSKSQRQQVTVSPEQCEWFSSNGEKQVRMPAFEELGSAVLSIRMNNFTSMEIPTEYKLYPNYPNPFNPTTTIAYDLPKAADVRLEIYNTMGQRVRVLRDILQDAGHYEMVWDGRNDSGLPVVCGLYIYEIKAGNFRDLRKMVLIR